MNVSVNLNEIFDAVKPGRLTIVVDGREYVVRPMSNLQVKQLFDEAVQRPGSPETLRLLKESIEGEPPPFEQWADDAEPKLGAFVRAVGTYYTALRAKKVMATGEAVRESFDANPGTS